MTRTITKDALGVFGVFRIGHDAFVQHATSSGPFQPTPGLFFGRLGRLGLHGAERRVTTEGEFWGFWDEMASFLGTEQRCNLFVLTLLQSVGSDGFRCIQEVGHVSKRPSGVEV